MFPFLEWPERYIQPRNSASNLILINDERDGTGYGTGEYNDFHRSSNSGESENKEKFKSQVSGRTKYMRRSKAKDDIDIAQMEFPQTIGYKTKRQLNPKKGEESIFDDLMTSQLRQQQYHERVMAEMEINNVLYAHLLKKEFSQPSLFSRWISSSRSKV